MMLKQLDTYMQTNKQITLTFFHTKQKTDFKLTIDKKIKLRL